MRFLVVVEDGQGKRRRRTVRAESESALRARLEGGGLKVRDVQVLADPPGGDPAAPAPPPPARRSRRSGEAASGPERGEDGSRGIPEGAARLLASLDRLLEGCDETAPSIQPSASIRPLMRESRDVIAATLGVLAKDVCRRLSRGRSRSQCADFLVDGCAMPRSLATSLVGMAVDAGRVAVSVAAGTCTEAEGVRTIVDGTRGAEERVVRALIEWIVPFVRSLDGKRFLEQVDPLT